MPRCKNCKQKFEAKRFLQKFCDDEHCVDAAIKYARAKVNEKRQQDSRKEKTTLRNALKTKSDYERALQKEINSIVRLIDEHYPCIATNVFKGKRNAGHYIGVKANPTIRFHLENIWVQSEHSNTWKSGDTIRYQQGIINTFGESYLEYMNSLQQIPPIKLSTDELRAKTSIARSIVKWLKLQDRKFTNEERISLRKEFNKKIGIYN